MVGCCWPQGNVDVLVRVLVVVLVGLACVRGMV